ncbi:hypothetical protein ACFL45_05085, partial [Candidatus Neomarinimicrobiota bacterium]
QSPGPLSSRSGPDTEVGAGGAGLREGEEWLASHEKISRQHTMIRRHFPGLLVIIASVMGGFGRPQMADELRVFALLSVIEDLIAGEVYEEMYPICMYKNGRYEEALQEIYDRRVRKGITGEEEKSRSILQRVGEYQAVFAPGMIDTYQVSSIEMNDYSCSEVVVGRGDSTAYSSWAVRHAPVVFWQRSSHRVDHPDGTRQFIERNHKIRQFPAISINTPIDPSKLKSLPFTFGPTRQRQIMALAREIFAGEEQEYLDRVRRRIEADSVQIEALQSYDLDGDGRYEHMAIIHTPLDPSLYAGSHTGVLVLWFAEQDQQLIPLLMIPGQKLRDWNWGIMGAEMYILDITGDGIPEVIYRSEGYEGWRYVIYEFKDGRFTEVFRGAGVGC